MGASNQTQAEVYPRVGGGTIRPAALKDAGDGLSPRGRGNPGMAKPPHPRIRSIPAWAGEPWRSLWRLPKAAVYPRVGGGTG